jgi:predicted ArsR family transcriptional regulator
VEELARELGVTDNAVRAQLQGLEKDGLVRPAGSRRGGGAGKPPTIYELTPEAEERLSHAFAPFLEAVLASASERLSTHDMDELLASVGTRLAKEHAAPAGSDRVAHALRVLESLGASASATHERNATTISASGCALGPVVAEHPKACHAMRALLEGLTGHEVEERCEHSPKPHCKFLIHNGK